MNWRKLDEIKNHWNTKGFHTPYGVAKEHIEILIGAVEQAYAESPTQWAYDNACDALKHWRAEAERLAALIKKAENGDGKDSCPWCGVVVVSGYSHHSTCEAFTSSGEVKMNAIARK